MQNRLADFLERKKTIIYLLQFGFRENYSTIYVLILLTNLLFEYLGKGNLPGGF